MKNRKIYRYVKTRDIKLYAKVIETRLRLLSIKFIFHFCRIFRYITN